MRLIYFYIYLLKRIKLPHVSLCFLYGKNFKMCGLCGFLSLELFNAADGIKASIKSYKTTRYLHNMFTEANFGRIFMPAKPVVQFRFDAM